MDLLVVTWNYPPRRGGIENLLKHLCAGLRERQRVVVVTSYGKAPVAIEPQVFRAPLPGLAFFAIYALWRGALILARSAEIRVVLGGSVLATPLVLILARLFRRYAVVLAHGLDVIHRNFFYQLLCARWLKYCDRIVANSQYTADLVKAKGVTEKRLTVISPGVDLDRFEGASDVIGTKRRWGLEGKKIILFVGRLAKRKGVKEFIERSLTEIVRRVPNAVFLIVGANPIESLAHRENASSEIEAALTRLGLGKHACLLGALGDSEITELYQACDAVVLPVLPLPHDVEGFGIVALEAAAAAKPLVATRVGGITDAVEAGKSGILVEPGDYQRLTEVMVELLQDPDRLSRLGRCARTRVRQRFAWRRVVEDYEKMLAELG